MTIIPDEFLDLMRQPAFAQLATVRPDGTPQVNPMYFDWDGSRLRFSHKSNRQKFRNIAQNPHIAASIPDLDNPYRYIEVRGTVEDVSPDVDGVFLRKLSARYSPGARNSPDIEHRVVITVVVTHAAGWAGRRPSAE